MKKLHDSKIVDILVISPSAEKREQLSAIFSVGGYSVTNLQTLSDALSEVIAGAEFSVAVIDCKASIDNNFEIIRKLNEKLPALQSIVISSDTGLDFALKANNQGVFWLLQEPYENEELLYLTARGLVVHALAVENKALRDAIKAPMINDKFIGQTEIMRKLMARIQKIASLDTTVLFTGESGTGKTLLASILHKRSQRSQGPFISISCANLPRDLLESELFVNEKGAFTGAISSRPGAIELCENGTLFLDEIGELPLDLQPKLLKFLQDKQVRRLGGKTSKQIDVRIICATNRNLEEAVASGQFREDLFYRVNVLHIRVPALRERIEDIPFLCEQFLLDIAKNRNKNKSWTLSAEALDFLCNYSWPGNIRELEHTLERATAFADGSILNVNDFEINSSRKTQVDQASQVGMTLKELEAKHIRETLRHCNGNKQVAATMLGVSLKTMYNRLKEIESQQL